MEEASDKDREIRLIKNQNCGLQSRAETGRFKVGKMDPVT